MDCYTYEHLKFDNPIFTTIQNAVILTMKNSSRHNRVKEEINKNPVCRNVIIQYNVGYKQCTKNYVDSSSKDLLHAVINALRKLNGNGPILILEDDVCFTSNLRHHAVHVDDFIKYNAVWDIYSLGSCPLIALPSLSRHVAVHYMGATHACIFSPNMITKMLDGYFVSRVHERMNKGFNLRIIPPTHDFVVSSMVRSYMYRIPLAVQSHEITENSKMWMSTLDYVIIKMFGADKNGESLYRFLHATTYTGGVLPTAFIFVIFSVIIITYRTRKNTNICKL